MLMLSCRKIVLVFMVFCISGCLEFGDDVEVSGAAFDAPKLAQITSLTGVSFPSGATGLDYLYRGSGIDDALAARVQIPESQKDEFMAQAVFTNGENVTPYIQIGKGKPWWNLDALVNRTDRSMNLPNAQFLEISLGHEGDDLVVYISWMST